MATPEPGARFAFYTAQGEPLANFDFEDLPLHKQAVLDKCLEIYNDANPCFIHENAVKVRMLYELQLFLEAHKKPVTACTLSLALKKYLPEEWWEQKIAYEV